MTFKERNVWMIDLILSVNLKDLFANNSLIPSSVKYLLHSVKLKYLPVVCTQPIAVVLSCIHWKNVDTVKWNKEREGPLDWPDIRRSPIFMLTYSCTVVDTLDKPIP